MGSSGDQPTGAHSQHKMGICVLAPVRQYAMQSLPLKQKTEAWGQTQQHVLRADHRLPLS
jgi:hypothetical protein